MAFTLTLDCAVCLDYSRRLLKFLALVHILLSVSVILSLPQILLASVFLWLYGCREPKKYLFLAFLPVLVGLLYYSVSPKYPFGLAFSVEQYIRANISRDRLYLFAMFGVFWSLYAFQGKLNLKLVAEEVKKGLPAFLLGLGMIACACGVIGLFKLKQGSFVQFPPPTKLTIP